MCSHYHYAPVDHGAGLEPAFTRFAGVGISLSASRG
jgi:hypothetical protein